MTPPGLAYAQSYPDATTCVVVGRLGSADIPNLRNFRSVLWFVDARNTGPAPVGLAPGALQLAPLDHLDSARLTNVLDDFVRHDARHLPSVFVTEDAVQQHPEAYQSILSTACAQLEIHHRARVTRQRDGFAWQKHVLQNLPAYARHRLPASWRGALRGRPAFVCGAGPSLDVSAPLLALHREAGVVLAADSALRTLARHGVAADFAVSIDVAKVPERCLPAEQQPARVVLSAVSPPAWMTAVPAENIFFAASRQITTAWLADAGVPHPTVSVAEHCGGTALELARHLGCAPIFLFGLDLALDATAPGRSHAAGAEPSLYADSGFDDAQRYPEVPGNYSETVPTHIIGDWRVLDARLGGWPSGLVRNVTDRGASLGNTILVHPDNFSLPPAAGDKPAALAALGPAETVDAAVLEAAFAQIREMGRRESAAISGLRVLLAKGGPPAVAAAFRPLFADKGLGRILGAFSLKIMPHLMPPLEGDSAFWTSLIDEYAALLALAQVVR